MSMGSSSDLCVCRFLFFEAALNYCTSVAQGFGINGGFVVTNGKPTPRHSVEFGPMGDHFKIEVTISSRRNLT